MVHMPHWPKPLGFKPEDFDLSRINALLEALGNPHHKLPPVVQIAGTNGKGSTTAFLRAIMEEAGYVVHCYTSPHLINFNERIVVAGNQIADGYLYEVLEKCRVTSETKNLPVTFFEGTTTAAFLAFAENKADIVLLETGMGGRLDATNAVPEASLSIITPISLDHTEYLGDTITKIAVEKAGIFKSGTRAVISAQSEEATGVLRVIAHQLNIQLIEYEYDFGIEPRENGFRYMTQNLKLDLPTPNLAGNHQFINASTAITAALAMNQFSITEKAIKKGITNAKWPARLQQLTNISAPDNWELWLDGAHNVAGAQVVADWLDDHNDDKPCYLIYGITKGRNCSQFLQPFIGRVKFIGGVRVESEPSAYAAEYLAAQARQVGFDSHPFSSLEEAVSYITGLSPNGRLVICGSLYLAGDVMRMQHSWQTN